MKIFVSYSFSSKRYSGFGSSVIENDEQFQISDMSDIQMLQERIENSDGNLTNVVILYWKFLPDQSKEA